MFSATSRSTPRRRLPCVPSPTRRPRSSNVLPLATNEKRGRRRALEERARSDPSLGAAFLRGRNVALVFALGRPRRPPTLGGTLLRPPIEAADERLHEHVADDLRALLRRMREVPAAEARAHP